MFWCNYFCNNYKRITLQSKFLDLVSCKKGHTSGSSISKKIFWRNYLCNNYKNYYKRKGSKELFCNNFGQDGIGFLYLPLAWKVFLWGQKSWSKWFSFSGGSANRRAFGVPVQSSGRGHGTSSVVERNLCPIPPRTKPIHAGKISWGINFFANTCGACIRTRANTGKYFWGGISRVFRQILRGIHWVRIHAAPVFAPARIQENIPVFAPARIQENIPGELFMYWFRARG